MKKIVSGGQTGVDRGALDAALHYDFPCGSWCPPGRKAEDGPIPTAYPLSEMPKGGYRERTAQDVLDSDATLIIYFDELGGGTEQTLLHCIRRHKPYKLVDANEISAQRAGALAASFVATHDIATLNVAGPRGSNVPAAHGFAYGCISYLLATVQGREPDHQLGRD